MPKPLQFSNGSIVYCKGEGAEKIFILQSGKISLVYTDIETGHDVRDQVQPGEFFGVRSALGRFPREENAVVLADSSVMALTIPEFETLAMSNTRIILKMLKVFSNQMRRIHRQVSKLMAKEEESPADGLFNVGEFYLKNKRFSHAKHVFSRYMTFYPSGKDAMQASKNLIIAENGISRYGDGRGPGISVGSNETPAAPKESPPSGSSKMSSAYSNALSLVSQGKYQEAFMSFKAIVDANADPELTAKSSFEIGRCMFLLNKYEDSLKYLTNMLAKYPKHPDLTDVMFIMGQCNEKAGRKDQAAAFYKKILSMSANSDEGTAAKAKRALSALGA
jgi:TolA-binding protein